LKARIATAREKTTTLQHRVEKCAQRAAVEEERERAEQRSHKRRIGFIWSFLGLLVILWVGGAVWGSNPAEWHGEGEIDFDELHRGNVELHDTLRSKGVEWALGEGLGAESRPDNRDAMSKERRYGPTGGEKAWTSAPKLPRERSKGEMGLDERLEHAFDTL
jgi:hypothetical protein